MQIDMSSICVIRQAVNVLSAVLVCCSVEKPLEPDLWISSDLIEREYFKEAEDPHSASLQPLDGRLQLQCCHTNNPSRAASTD